MSEKQQTRQSREECFGLRPIKAGVTLPYLLQWIDPTFDAAEPTLNEWLQSGENTYPRGVRG